MWHDSLINFGLREMTTESSNTFSDLRDPKHNRPITIILFRLFANIKALNHYIHKHSEGNAQNNVQSNRSCKLPTKFQRKSRKYTRLRIIIQTAIQVYVRHSRSKVVLEICLPIKQITGCRCVANNRLYIKQTLWKQSAFSIRLEFNGDLIRKSCWGRRAEMELEKISRVEAPILQLRTI